MDFLLWKTNHSLHIFLAPMYLVFLAYIMKFLTLQNRFSLLASNETNNFFQAALAQSGKELLRTC